MNGPTQKSPTQKSPALNSPIIGVWKTKRTLAVVLLAMASVLAPSSLLAQSAVTSRYTVNPTVAPEPRSGSESPSDAKVVRQGGFPTLNIGSADDPTQPISESQQSSRLTGNAVSVVASLTVVLGLFAGFVWMTRRFGGAAANAGVLPAEVFAHLGSTSIDARTRVSLLRCGSKILVVSQTATGTTPIAEITDVDEVHAIAAACTGESKNQFLETLRKFESQPTAPGFAGDTEAQPSPPSRGRLFASV